MFASRNYTPALLLALIVATTLIVVLPGKANRCEGPTAGQWNPLRSAQLKRTEVAAARVGKSIYVVGGFAKPDGATTAAVERYSIDKNRWSRVADAPAALNHAAAVAHGGKLYLVGGYKGKQSLDDDSDGLFEYTPVRDRWRRLEDMPTARGGLTAAVVKGRLYAIGGTSLGKDLTTSESYHFRSGKWRKEPSMKVARNHIAAASFGDDIYVFGGRSSTASNLTTVERFDTKSREWQSQPSLKKERSGIAAATVGKTIVVFGGEEAAGTIAPVEAFNTKCRSWSSLPDMRTPRHGLGGVSYRNRIYAIEGGPEPGFAFSNKLEALDLEG